MKPLTSHWRRRGGVCFAADDVMARQSASGSTGDLAELWSNGSALGRSNEAGLRNLQDLGSRFLEPRAQLPRSNHQDNVCSACTFHTATLTFRLPPAMAPVHLLLAALLAAAAAPASAQTLTPWPGIGAQSSRELRIVARRRQLAAWRVLIRALAQRVRTSRWL